MRTCGRVIAHFDCGSHPVGLLLHFVEFKQHFFHSKEVSFWRADVVRRKQQHTRPAAPFLPICSGSHFVVQRTGR